MSVVPISVVSGCGAPVRLSLAVLASGCHLVVPLVALAWSCAAPDAGAATIRNVDTRVQTLAVAGEDPEKKIQIAPRGQVENVCPQGCVLRLNDSNSDDYIIEGGEILSIEGGTLYYDGEIPKSSKKDANGATDTKK